MATDPVGDVPRHDGGHHDEDLLTTVTLTQPSALRRLVAALRADREILPVSAVIPEHVDADDYYQAQRAVFRESRMLAAAAAANSLGLPVSGAGDGSACRRPAPAFTCGRRVAGGRRDRRS